MKTQYNQQQKKSSKYNMLEGDKCSGERERDKQD